MLPIGAERDTQIADFLNSDWIVECIIGCECKFIMSEVKALELTECPSCSEDIKIYPPKYSTDISAAMELFAELPTGSTIYKAKDGYTIRVYFGYKERWKTLHKADDIPDAISGAWLKWKENSQ